jgi:tetratricopeptide (TPR) repeat protein
MMESFDWAVWGPALTVIFAGFALGLGLARKQGGTPHADQGARQDLERERELAVEALKALEIERTKMDPEAYQQERDALLTRGAGALRELDHTDAVRQATAGGSSAGDGMAPEWKGALTMLAVVAVAGLFYQFASKESSDRAPGTTMTGNVSAPNAAAQDAELLARMEANPNDLDAANALTRSALMQGDAVGAMEWNQKAAALDPTDPAALTYRAVLADTVGMTDRAIEGLQAVTGAHPGHGDAWAYLGVFMIRTGRPGEAIGPLERAAELLPQEPGLKELVTQAKAMARAQANLPPGGDAPPAGDAPTVVSGTVSLPDGVTVTGTETVYVSLRSPAGGPPLAALKLPVAAFPMAFTVTEADAIRMGGAPRPFPDALNLKVAIDGDGNPMTGDDVLAEATLEGVAKGASGIEVALAPR